jgi:hypothetical protein
MRQSRIKIISIRFYKPACLRGRSDVAVSITLNGVALGDAADRWTVRPRGKITFNPDKYSTVIDLEGRTDPLDLSVTPRIDEPGNVVTIGGPLQHKIPWPFSPRAFSPTRKEFVLEWEIENVNPSPETPSASGIYACREDKSGAVLYNTAGNVHHKLRVEVHEVLPTPHGFRKSGPGPMRPRLLSPWTDGGKAKTTAELTTGTDLNIIENPALISIPPTGTDADGTNCAKFRVTYYWPKGLNFTDDDSRLVWKVVPTGGGNARFFGRSTGRLVSLHGCSPGEINLEVRFENTQVAVYRALVKPLVIIPYRCTILYGHATQAQFRPRSTTADVRTHLLISNRFLWQMGLKLEPFKSNTVGWQPASVAMTITPVAGETGFFTADVPGIWTRQPPDVLCAVVNSLPYVFNFAYIKSDPTGNRGAGCYMEIAGAATIDDSGTPSSSWTRPSGVNPDGAAGKITMTCMPNYAMFQNALFPHRFAMYVTDANVDNLDFSGTISHELGHVIGLNHRIEGTGGYDDKVAYPPRQNVMHWVENSDVAQDFDIIQAKQVRLSPLLSPPAGGRPAPTP